MRAFLLFFRDVWGRSFSMNVYLTPPPPVCPCLVCRGCPFSNCPSGVYIDCCACLWSCKEEFSSTIISLIEPFFLHFPEIIFNDTMFVFIFSILIFFLPAFAPNKMFFNKRKKQLYDENCKKYIL